jgi:TolA-binding protein
MKKNDNLTPVADTSGRQIPGLYKSMDTGAIIAEKSAEYQRYLRERERIKHVQGLESQIDTLQSEVNELKDLLKQSLENKT